MIADMATGVEAARSLYLSAARRKDAINLDYSTQAAMAKLFATDMCMQVTTNAVQILGGAGYVQDFLQSATSANPRCCKSWRAPTRSNGSSSVATCSRTSSPTLRPNRERRRSRKLLHGSATFARIGPAIAVISTYVVARGTNLSGANGDVATIPAISTLNSPRAASSEPARHLPRGLDSARFATIQPVTSLVPIPTTARASATAIPAGCRRGSY